MKHLLALFVASAIVLTSMLVQSSAAQLPDAPIVLDNGSGGCTPTTEICGDGIDQDCNGSDARCPGTDGDWDGVAQGVDCDDNNRHIYPGVYVSCSATCGQGTKLCQSSGSYSTCSCTPLCEAKGSGRCYYVSKLTGSDTNSGTFDKPLKTYLRFNPGNPAGSQISLQAGDVVYLMSGLYTENYSYENVQTAIYLNGRRGTSSTPIVVKAYPGAHPVISPSVNAYGVYLINDQYVTFDGIEIAGTYGAGVIIYESSYIEMRNMWVHDTDGLDNNNVAGFYINTVDHFTLDHSLVHDNYDRTNEDTGGEKTENSRNIVLFEGGNAKLSYNVVFQTPPITASKTGGCITYKHGQQVAGGTFEVDHTVLWNCFFHSIGTSTYNGNFHHNLILNSDQIHLKNLGGTTNIKDNVFQFNTIVGGRGLAYLPSQAGTGNFGLLTFKKNLVVDNGSYNSDIGGIIAIDPYGTDDFYSSVVSGNMLSFSSNCYYNPNQTAMFGLFSYNYGTNMSAGGLYDFATWRSKGYDSGSSVTNPQLDSNFVPQASTCSAFGRYAK